MKFFMEKNKDAGHRVTINIPKITVSSAVTKELLNIQRKTNVNGFRKGKTPIKIIQKKYGHTIYYDVFKELMQKFFYEFIDQEKIKIIGYPKYYIHQEDKKKEHFEYSVIFEYYPKFNMQDIKNIEAKKIIIKITDEDIKNSIEKHITTKSNWKKINQSIKSYDRVTINYTIYEKNKIIEKFQAKNISFIVSENTFIPELNYKIINHVVNDVFFFTTKFHQFHPEKELQNKDITFKVKIIEIEKKQDITSTENNIKKINQKELNLLNQEKLKNNIQTEIKKITCKYLEDQIIQNITKKNIISIPPILFQEEIKVLYKEYTEKYKKNHGNILQKKYHIDFDLLAKKRLCFKIIIDRIISDNKLFIDEKEIISLIKKISLNYKKPKEIINLYLQNKNFKNTIKNIELERQAMNILKKTIRIKTIYWNFEQFINYKWEIMQN